MALLSGLQLLCSMLFDKCLQPAKQNQTTADSSMIRTFLDNSIIELEDSILELTRTAGTTAIER